MRRPLPWPFARVLAGALALLAALGLAGCGYNNFQSQDEQVKAAWAEVLNQYQRRSDLVPNIVATVKGEASFEQDTLTKVIEARSKATSIQATPELVNDPEAFDKFQKAQGELTGALSRLMVVSEQYPQLKANQAFQDLRVTLDLFRKGGEAILDGIAAQDYDVLRGRPVVTKRRKLMLLVGALLGKMRAGGVRAA